MRFKSRSAVLAQFDSILIQFGSLSCGVDAKHKFWNAL